jgi:hypothetical protein
MLPVHLPEHDRIGAHPDHEHHESGDQQAVIGNSASLPEKSAEHERRTDRRTEQTRGNSGEPALPHEYHDEQRDTDHERPEHRVLDEQNHREERGRDPEQR